MSFSERLAGVARADDFGRDDPRPPGRPARREWAVFIALLAAFLGLALGADLLPGRKFYFEAQIARMTPFFEFERLTPALRYYNGNAVGSFRSLPYMLVLKAAHTLVPARLLSLRLVSVAATAVSLVLMFRLASRLFCPGVALLWIFSLVFSPLWLDGMRAYGYLPFTHLFVVLGCVALTLPGEGRRAWIKAAVLALAVYATLSLYLPSHLIFWLSVIYLLLAPRREGKTLVLFLAFFFGVTVGVDRLLGDVALNFRDFLLPEIGGEWIMKGPRMDGGLLEGNLFQNAPLLLRPLLSYSALPLPAIFTALSVAGVLLSLCLRRRSNIFALLWLSIFLLSPLTSNAIPFRRIVFAFAPLHLAGALGGWFLFRLAGTALGPAWSRRLLVPSALALLIFLALLSSRSFLREVSRPDGNPTRESLNYLAAFVLERGETDAQVMYDERIADLVWGNPALADRVSEDLHRRMVAVTPAAARRFHRSGLERSPRPSIVLYRRSEEEAYRDLPSWAAELTGEEVVRGAVPGTEIEFIILPCPAGLPPELLTQTSAVLRASSSHRRRESAWVRDDNLRNNLTDGDPTQHWAPDPGAQDQAPWVEADFGTGGGRTVRVIGLLPGGDPPSARGFLRRGELAGSDDGKEWDRIAVIEEENPDPGTGWRFWIVPNGRALRFYRLTVFDPPPREFRGLGDLVLYESENAFVLLRPEEGAIVRRAAAGQR